LECPQGRGGGAQNYKHGRSTPLANVGNRGDEKRFQGEKAERGRKNIGSSRLPSKKRKNSKKEKKGNKIVVRRSEKRRGGKIRETAWKKKKKPRLSFKEWENHGSKKKGKGKRVRGT